MHSGGLNAAADTDGMGSSSDSADGPRTRPWTVGGGTCCACKVRGPNSRIGSNLQTCGSVPGSDCPAGRKCWKPDKQIEDKCKVHHVPSSKNSLALIQVEDGEASDAEVNSTEGWGCSCDCWELPTEYEIRYARAEKGSDDALHRIQGLLKDADELSAKTVSQLHKQTEQLERIDGRNEDIAVDLDDSEESLKSLKAFGWLHDLFKRKGKDPTKSSSRRRRTKAEKKPSRSRSSGGRGSSDKGKTSPGRHGAARGGGTDGKYDEAYDDIEQMLLKLKERSKVMGNYLDYHNEALLPGISEKIDRNDVRIKDQTREMRSMLD